MVALLALALAAEPEPVDPHEVIVYGELAVTRARAAVEEELARLGYNGAVVDMGDHMVFRHSEAWKGEVLVFDDGWMEVRRQPIQAFGRAMPWTKEGTPVAWLGCFVYPYLCMRLNGAMVGHRKWMGVETKTVQGVYDEVQTYGDRVADLAVTRKLDTLPDQLEALWADGTPLQGDEPYGTPAERRAALMNFWDSRTDTPWGEVVRGSVESFCRAVVQTSEAPFTDEEIAAFNANRTAERPFSLTKR